jgi:UMF1 family MFS transporter
MASNSAADTHSERPAASSPALVGWVLFDWAAQPYYTLILTFLFAPYFANTVVGDPARGQAIWGYGAAAAGVLIAVGSPLLGAVADGRGHSKPWIALFSLMLASGMAALWFAEPGTTGIALWLIVLAFIMATVAAEFTTVFTNAIMPTLVPPSQIGRLSGIGWGVGYAGGLISLGVMAGLIVTNPATGKTLLGLDPLLALDTVSRQGDRLVGPFSAAWYLLFMIPFFLFVPDRRREDAAGAKASPVAELLSTLRDLVHHRDILLFLIARAIYVDGLSAIFAFGGIYGSSVFGWHAFELGLFGIVLTLTGAVGAVVGGFLDDRWGAKRVIIVSLLLLLAGSIGILSVTKTHVLFGIEVPVKAPGSTPFSSLGEIAYLGFAMLIGVVAAPVQAASRSLLARLAPPGKMTQFFGLFAFSGKVTAFAAPFLIATITASTGSQRAGISVIAAFLLTGMLLMIPVRTSNAR